MSSQTESQFKLFIDNYMQTNKAFDKDITLFTEWLTKSPIDGQNKQMIVIFSHEMDINSLIDKNNQHFIEKLLRKDELFSEIFEKLLKKKIKTLLNGRKLWFCLKYTNFAENKNLIDLKSTKSRLISINRLQIQSMSQTSRVMIGRKFQNKDANQSEDQFKWFVRNTNGKGFPKSDKYVATEERVFLTKRKLIPKRESKVGKYIEITVLLELFNERQIQCLYNGSNLDSVVLREESLNSYLMLSFGHIVFRPFPPLESELTQFLQLFPQQVIQLFNDRKSSKYSFPLSLSFIFGERVAISGSFFRLKLGLLLSLLSLNEYPKKNHSSVLVICDDTVMIQRLFEWSSLLCDYRYKHKSLSVPMSGVSRQQTYNNRTTEWIDSGALQLGADGITTISCVSNLNDLPPKERTALFHALETNEVIPKSSQPLEPSQTEHQLKSTIWAVIEDNINERQFQSKLFKSQTILWPEVFGMVYVIQKTRKYIYNPRLCPESSIRFDEWQTIIRLMSQIKPKMTEMAKKLLQQYYVSNRRIRGSKLNHISMESLVCLSKSFAKLSLRLQVLKYDALLAILLYEESLTSRLPERKSPLSVSPISHVSPEDMNSAIGPNCDHMMDEFEKTLIQFLRQNMTQNPENEIFSQFFRENEE